MARVCIILSMKIHPSSSSISFFYSQSKTFLDPLAPAPAARRFSTRLHYKKKESLTAVDTGNCFIPYRTDFENIRRAVWSGLFTRRGEPPFHSWQLCAMDDPSPKSTLRSEAFLIEENSGEQQAVPVGFR